MKRILQLIFIASVIQSHFVNAQSTYVRRGFLDLKQWDFQQRGSVALNGEWEFYMSELIHPDTLSKTTNTPKDYLLFPSTWNEISQSLKPGNGYATYRVKILVRSPQELAIEIPHFYSNFTLWINGEVVAKNGEVNTSESTSKPEWRPQTVSFKTDKDTLDFVIQASNFHHAKGGVRGEILLGDPEDLFFKREVAVTSNLALFGALSLTAIVFIGVYLFVKRDLAALGFAALCLSWGTRSMFSNLYLGNHFFPEIPWELCVKIEYITLYLTMAFAILFISSLFPKDVNHLFKYFLFGCNIIFMIFTWVSRAGLYTQFLPVYLSFAVVLLLYIIYVLIRAIVKERQGVWLILSCIMLGVVIFAYDLVAYQGFAAFNPIVTSVGYLVIFILLALALSYQFRFMNRTSRQEDVLRYEDLYDTTHK